jgi:hypothetical protein
MKIKFGTVITLTVSTVMYEKIRNLANKEFSYWVDDIGPIEGLDDRRMIINISRLIRDSDFHHSDNDDESLDHQRYLKEFKEAFSNIVFGNSSFDFSCLSLIQVEEDQSME